MTAAAFALAAAFLLTHGPSRVRMRAFARPAAGPGLRRPAGAHDALAAAAAFDVLAACLSSGMAVAGAARAVAPYGPPELDALLCRAADLLSLGADPATAWAEPDGPLDRQARALLRLARRSACSGSALADGVAELAAESRQEAIHAATAAAERAGVIIAGPLGVCFLPAFACLGVFPVVAGLAGDVFTSGVL